MKLKLTYFIIAGVVFFTANAYAGGAHKAPKKTVPPKKFIDRANMDFSVKPGDNFYDYANGNWLKTAQIPAQETSWGSFSVLANDNAKKLLALINTVAGGTYPAGSIKQRVGDFYASGTDTATIEMLGYNPIKADLKRVNDITDLAGVVNEIAYQKANSIGSPFFDSGVGQDAKHPTNYVVGFSQGGTTLPDRDYYLSNTPSNIKAQTALKQYISTLFQLTGSGADASQRNADIVFNVEDKLAQAQWTRTQTRDREKTYHKFAVADFAKTTPHLNWVKLLPQMKIFGQDSVLVAEPSFYTAADALIGNTSVDELKVYLDWQILKRSANYLSSPFVKASFVYGSVLSGQKVQKPRDERIVRVVDGTIGELLGQLYVEKYFPPAAKAYMLSLVNNLKTTLGERIKRLDWMSADTKVRALKKLSTFSVKIGYPDKWKDYGNVAIIRNDYYGNLMRISRWNYDDNIAKLGKPVDKTLWGMTPPTVNAYYNSVNNEIVFPAGILQSPFFNFAADDAVNYGGIGVVIGHEMTHGFDDQGRKSDADGTLRDWWTKQDAENFKARAERVATQYNNFVAVDTMHVNGHLTLGENLADLGGLNIAYEAFKKTKEGHTNKPIDGFTPDQRFFLSFANVWRELRRPETVAQLTRTDPHSPGRFRTNGPITNMDAWYKAFNIQPGDAMYKAPADRIKIW